MNTFIPMCIRVQGVIERCSDIMTSHVCGVDDMCMDASCIKYSSDVLLYVIKSV